jgi:glucose-1-phosphate cytidylyltransferase
LGAENVKVVLFCGGLGLRMRDVAERLPKPMVPIGDRPLLLHVMQYYAHFGHTEFILCLGYRGQAIKEYFLNYNEALLTDFVLSNGGRQLQLLKSDVHHWKITFVDTGLNSNIGQRLCLVRNYISQDEIFLANYADGLTDLSLPTMLAHFLSHDKTASFLCVKPTYSFQVVSVNERHLVEDIRPLNACNMWINGGYFIFRNDIFRYLGQGEDLVEEPFQRLIGCEQLLAHRYQGFWTSMDTFQDRQRLEALYAGGRPPWAVWLQMATPASWTHPCPSASSPSV